MKVIDNLIIFPKNLNELIRIFKTIVMDVLLNHSIAKLLELVQYHVRTSR